MDCAGTADFNGDHTLGSRGINSETRAARTSLPGPCDFYIVLTALGSVKDFVYGNASWSDLSADRKYIPPLLTLETGSAAKAGTASEAVEKHKRNCDTLDGICDHADFLHFLRSELDGKPRAAGPLSLN